MDGQAHMNICLMFGNCAVNLLASLLFVSAICIKQSSEDDGERFSEE